MFLNFCKQTLFFCLLTISTIASAEIFPGTTITLKEDLKVFRSKDPRDWASEDQVFRDGQKVEYTEEANAAGITLCKIMGGDENNIIHKGTFHSIGRIFHRYSQSGKPRESLVVKCYQSVYNERTNQSYFWETEPTPAILTQAFGNNVTFSFAVPEQLKIGNFTFTTGVKRGDEKFDNGYGAVKCEYTLFRVENKYKVLMRSEHMTSCSMDVMSINNSKNQLEVSGIEGLDRTPCKMTFYIQNGKLTNKVYMLNEYNWTSSICYIK